jgi:hypothetical protein
MKGRGTRDTRRLANVSGRDVPLLRRVLFGRRGLQDRLDSRRGEAGEGIGAVTCTPPRRLSPAFTLPERIVGPALIVDLLPIDPDSYNTKRPDPYTLKRFGSMTGVQGVLRGAKYRWGQPLEVLTGLGF